MAIAGGGNHTDKPPRSPISRHALELSENARVVCLVVRVGLGAVGFLGGVAG